MFRSLLAVLAALVVTSGTATASRSDAPLNERITSAQAKLNEIVKLTEPDASEKKFGSKLAQHWNNHRWNNHWNNWHNWGNHRNPHH
ncbi:MAG: hypothetical protein K2P86_14210 [Xanthobacteraceae bacterium]|nr:hypothetical protein [Xanthobacteraceae bacterium]